MIKPQATIAEPTYFVRSSDRQVFAVVEDGRNSFLTTVVVVRVVANWDCELIYRSTLWQGSRSTDRDDPF